MLGVNKLPQVSEHRMQIIRWLLTVSWLAMIASLFWDPLSAYLTDPSSPVSPFRFDPSECVLVQGQCLPQQPSAIAAFIFWSLVVPSSILILLVFGHETWRRICPLSFLSQIPRALGIQRKRKVAHPGTGATRYELVKIRKDSWLGKNHLYVQFTLLVLGLSARLLLVNSNHLALGIFLVGTIAIAITVGYLYEGKSWCQYFCPMAPVQMVFTGPRGLLGSEAHQGQRQAVTQSMCRTVDKEGQVKSACVGCQSPCIDIDAERNYWETSNKAGRRFVHYGYVGLLLGFFLYYFLYAGSFDYLFSGAWLREANSLGNLFKPGFYIAGRAIAIPKIVAVPLTLTLSVFIGYSLLMGIEKAYRNYFKRLKRSISAQYVTHLVFSFCTFFAFNTFFFFSSRSLLDPFPFPVHLLFNAFLVLVSTLWLSRTLDRSAELYTRESLAGSLRRQLGKLAIDFSRFLEGRSMDDLKAEEVYVLAKVLPGFNQEMSLQVYKGVLREALEQGNTDSASSLEILRQIRQELNLKDEDHFTVLTELGLAEPDLLDVKKRRTRESQLRLESYRQALASMLLDLVDGGMSLQEAMQHQKKQIQFLKLEYGMTSEEEENALSQLLEGEKSTILRKAEGLLEQMQQLAGRNQSLSNQALEVQTPVFRLLRLTAVQNKQQIITKQMLGLLEVLGDAPESIQLADATRLLAASAVSEILQMTEGTFTWRARLKPEVLGILEGSLAESSPGVSVVPSPRQAEPGIQSREITDLNGTPASDSKFLAGNVGGAGSLPPFPTTTLGMSWIKPDFSTTLEGIRPETSFMAPEFTPRTSNGHPEETKKGIDAKTTGESVQDSHSESVDSSPNTFDSRSSSESGGLESEFDIRFKPDLDAALEQESIQVSVVDLPSIQAILRSPTVKSLAEVLDELLQDLDPLIQSLALYGLNLLTPPKGQEQAKQCLGNNHQGHWLVQETAEDLLNKEQQRTANEVQTLITQTNLKGKTEKRVFQQAVVRVGSDAANDLVLADGRVAPYHAVFYLDGEGFSLVDLGIGGGSLVGGKHLRSEGDRLSKGQVVRLGDAKGPAINVYWEKQPLRSQAPSAVLGTLDKVLLLFESRFFRSLKPEALVELAREATVKVYPRGKRMCKAGDPSDSILLLIDGTADVIILRGETKQVVATVNVGETIGEMGVLTRQKRSAYVVSASDYCRVLVIQADKFDSVLRQDPEIARNLLVVLSSRLQSMTNKVKSTAKAS